MKYIHDLMHCKNEQCKDRNKCYRYNAYKEIQGTDFGLVSMYMPKEMPTKKCEFFMKDE